MGNGASRSLQDCKKSGGKALTLDNCSLTSFPKNVFKDFPNLETLSLNRNQVSFRINKQFHICHRNLLIFNFFFLFKFF